MRELGCCLCVTLLACQQTEVAPPPPPAAADPTVETGSEPILPLPLRVEVDPRRAALGDRLFHEPAISADGKLACISCHPLDRGGTDGLQHSRGLGGKPTPLNTLTIFNVGFSFRYNWDGSYATLEEQLEAPLQRSMGSTVPEAIAR